MSNLGQKKIAYSHFIIKIGRENAVVTVHMRRFITKRRSERHAIRSNFNKILKILNLNCVLNFNR